MPGPVILAIDQGTTNTKGLLVDQSGAVVARSSRPMTVTHPKSGWAEQSPGAIWETVKEVINELAGHKRVIAGLAISNQRESAVVWDAASGEAIGPCVLWQCRRSSDRCAALRRDGLEAEIVERSGLGLDPLFPATKIAWLLDNVPGARERAARGELRAGTVDSWLVWNLTGGQHLTDYSNASRTQLFNLESLEWDRELAKIFDVPLSLLPEIASSDSKFGVTAAGASVLEEGLPIHAVLGDSHAALFGHGFARPGNVKVTLGTGSSLMAVTERRVRSKHGLSSTIAWGRKAAAAYALEGNISVSGQIAAFTTALLGLSDEEALTKLAQSVADSEGVCFVPALAGLGAPHWRDEARGLISGMSLSTRKAHVARASLEAITLQIADVFAAMEADLGQVLPKIHVDGGASRNDFLMGLLADVLDRDVVRGASPDLSALGAARMAAEALGFWSPGDYKQQGEVTTFRPNMEPARREKLLSLWNEAVARAAYAPRAQS